MTALRDAKLDELADVERLMRWLHDGPTTVCLCRDCSVIREFVRSTVTRINHELITGELTRD